MTADGQNPAICRDCGGTSIRGRRCGACGSPRILSHPELHDLTIAHLDCDAFYAAVEKRDNPELRAKPVIVGGGQRGVVATCCYLARTSGVHSAMPMTQARKLCPDAVVLRPDMAKYRRVSAGIRALMEGLTPLVEPLSLDEAFLDLTGTARLHGRSPAAALVALARRIESEIGVTVSIGLSYNKFLAKVASDLRKPRGFAIIGRGEALEFLADQPVSLIWGVGRAMRARLAADGITRISQLQRMSEIDLMRRYGAIGQRLAAFARGEDNRKVEPFQPPKSISTEETFDADIGDPETLEAALWNLCEDLAGRLRAKGYAGRTVVLKLKTARFELRTRNQQLDAPTQLATVLFRTARHMLRREAAGVSYRLLGIGVGDLHPPDQADPPDLVDREREQARRAEAAMAHLRAKFGKDAILKGRSLKSPR